MRNAARYQRSSFLDISSDRSFLFAFAKPCRPILYYCPNIDDDVHDDDDEDEDEDEDDG